jgi:hypothetical protein
VSSSNIFIFFFPFVLCFAYKSIVKNMATERNFEVRFDIFNVGIIYA